MRGRRWNSHCKEGYRPGLPSSDLPLLAILSLLRKAKVIWTDSIGHCVVVPHLILPWSIEIEPQEVKTIVTS